MRTRQKCVATDTWRFLGCRTTPAEENQQLNLDIQTDLNWTPGQANIHGNEVADKLAKEAAAEAASMPEITNAISNEDIKRAAKESCEQKWQRRWEAADTERHLFQYRSLVSHTVFIMCQPKDLFHN